MGEALPQQRQQSLCTCTLDAALSLPSTLRWCGVLGRSWRAEAHGALCMKLLGFTKIAAEIEASQQSISELWMSLLSAGTTNVETLVASLTPVQAAMKRAEAIAPDMSPRMTMADTSLSGADADVSLNSSTIENDDEDEDEGGSMPPLVPPALTGSIITSLGEAVRGRQCRHCHCRRAPLCTLRTLRHTRWMSTLHTEGILPFAGARLRSLPGLGRCGAGGRGSSEEAPPALSGLGGRGRLTLGPTPRGSGKGRRCGLRLQFGTADVTAR